MKKTSERVNNCLLKKTFYYSIIFRSLFCSIRGSHPFSFTITEYSIWYPPNPKVPIGASILITEFAGNGISEVLGRNFWLCLVSSPKIKGNSLASNPIVCPANGASNSGNFDLIPESNALYI